MAGFVIEEVPNLDVEWREIGPLMREQHEYHMRLSGHALLPDWETKEREHWASQEPGLDLVARQAGRALGFLNGRIVSNPEIFEETFGFISNAYVRAEVRRQGVGRALLERAEAWYESHGVAEVRLTVVAANLLGVRFWEQNGFAVLTQTMSKALGAPAHDTC